MRICLTRGEKGIAGIFSYLILQKFDSPNADRELFFVVELYNRDGPEFPLLWIKMKHVVKLDKSSSLRDTL